MLSPIVYEEARFLLISDTVFFELDAQIRAFTKHAELSRQKLYTLDIFFANICILLLTITVKFDIILYIGRFVFIKRYYSPVAR